MINQFKHLILGPPLPTTQFKDKRLRNLLALAAYSPDALSSIAYANQEIYLGLVVAGAAGLSLTWVMGLTIAILLVIVATSYYQTIQGYPTGGGSYTVARENLGVITGLTSAAALMIDYLLNVAVSLTAGVAAIASAFPELWPYRILISLTILLIISIINMRGMKESGMAMAIPVYLFLITYFGMLVYGVFLALNNSPVPLETTAPSAVEPLTIFLVLRTFSAGCTALTGIEAISNGVPAFTPPESRNAGRTLIVMALLMALLFLGSTGLTQYFGIVANPSETILSALARHLLGRGPFYFIIQFTTLLILSVAANTSFAGFPRLAAILANDNFLPRQLKMLGDRLVFQNGIFLLSLGAAFLIIFFQGDSHLLIPLFAIGAFLAFTLSQTGMVVHWFRMKKKGWQVKAFINAIGALATGTTLLIIAISKFIYGAWLTILLIPLIIFVFLKIQNHYKNVSKQLSLRGLSPSLKPLSASRVVVPISGVHRGIIEAMNFALSISSQVTAVYIETDPGETRSVKEQWKSWWPDVPLDVVPSPYRSIVGPLLSYLDRTDREHHDGAQAIIILSEFIPAHWWQGLLHNQTALLIKTALLYRRRHKGFQQVIIDVPYHLKS